MRAVTDSPISFPGLFGDWEFTLSSKALDIGNGIYWYGILIAIGFREPHKTGGFHSRVKTCFLM